MSDEQAIAVNSNGQAQTQNLQATQIKNDPVTYILKELARINSDVANLSKQIIDLDSQLNEIVLKDIDLKTILNDVVLKADLSRQLADLKTELHDLALKTSASPNGTPPLAPQAPPAAVPPEAVPLTLRLEPQGETTRVFWEADVLGQRESVFRSPFDVATLPLVTKVLDAVQRGELLRPIPTFLSPDATGLKRVKKRSMCRLLLEYVESWFSAVAGTPTLRVPVNHLAPHSLG